MAVNLPRLLGEKGQFEKLIYPVRVSVNQKLTPLSTASIELPAGEELPARAYVEVFTPLGSAGVFRVRSPEDAYGEETATAELEHAITEVGDYLVKDKIDKMMAASTAMETVFKHYKGSCWKLGNVSDLGSGQIAVSANYDRVLDVMLDILKQKPNCMLSFSFASFPWTVSVVKKGTTVAAEGRLARNVTSARVSYDDSELCTRAYYETYDSKGKFGTWAKLEKNVKKYGVVERTVSTNQNMKAAEIASVVNTYLNEHSEPSVSVQIRAMELSRITGEDLDKFVCGALCRLALPDYGVTVERNITEVRWNDVYGDPDACDVRLADEADTVVKFIHDMDSKGGGGGGGRSRKKDEDEWKEYYTRIEQSDTQISLTATRVDKTEKILEQAGMKLNSKGVLIYAVDKKNDKYLSSKISVLSDKISLVVTGEGKDAKLDVASIVMGINKQKGSFVLIKASTINLNGYVTAKELGVVDAKITNLTSGQTLAGSIRANHLAASSSFSLKGKAHNNSTITIDGVNFNIVTWS